MPRVEICFAVTFCFAVALVGHRIFAHLQGPICYNDAQNKGMIYSLLDIIRVKFAYHFRINYDLNLETAEFLELGVCDFGETLFSARH